MSLAWSNDLMNLTRMNPFSKAQNNYKNDSYSAYLSMSIVLLTLMLRYFIQKQTKSNPKTNKDKEFSAMCVKTSNKVKKKRSINTNIFSISLISSFKKAKKDNKIKQSKKI